jgi:hypothetical protein
MHRDVICVLQNVHTPFVLRPIGGKFEIIGEGYVEGFMNGEKTKKSPNKTLL